MAGIKKIIQYDVIVNGTPTVVKSLKDVEDHIAGLADRLKEINRKIQNGDLTAQMAASLEDEAKRINEETKQLRKVATDIKAYQGDMESISRSIANGTKSLNEINKMYRKVQEKLRIVQPGDEENTQKIRDLLREILAVKKDLEKPMKGGFTDKEMEAQAKATLEAVKTMNALKGNSLGAEMPKVSRNELEQAINYYDGIVKSYREMDPAAESARKKVKLLQDELNKYVHEFVDNPKLQAEQNTKDNRRGIMLAAAGKGLGAEGNEFVDSSTGKQRKYTNQELQEAIKLTKELADTTAIGSNTQKGYVNQLKAVEDQQRKVNEAEKQRIADMQSKQDKKDAEATLRAAKKNDGKIFNDQSKDIDTEALQKALKYYEDLRKGMRDMSEEAIKTDANIAILNKELNKYADAAKQRDDAALETKRSAIMDAAGSGRNTYTDADGKAVGYSKKDLDEAIKLTKELAESTNLGTEAQTKYANQLKMVEEQIKRVNESQAKSEREDWRALVMDNIETSSTKDIEEAIKATEELARSQVHQSDTQRQLNADIERAKEYLNRYKKEEEELQKLIDAETKESARADIMANLEVASTKEIEDAIKATEELAKSQIHGSDEQKKYNEEVRIAKEYLESFAKAEQQAADEEAERHRSAVMSDAGSFSTKEIEEAIKATEQLRDKQKIGSDEQKKYNDEIDAANKVLEENRQMLSDEKIGYTDFADVLDNKAFRSIDQLKRAEQELEQALKSSGLDDANRIAISSQLAEARGELARREKMVADAMKEQQRDGVLDRDVNTATADQLRSDIKILEQWRDSIKSTDDEWDAVNNKLNDTKKVLGEYEEKVKSSMLAADGYTGVEDIVTKLAEAETKRSQVASDSSQKISDSVREELNSQKELLDALEASKGDAGIPGLDELISKDQGFDEFIAKYKETGTALDEIVEKYKQLHEEEISLDPFSGDEDEAERYNEVRDQLDELEKQIAEFDGDVEIEVEVNGDDEAILSTKNLKRAEEELKKELANKGLTEKQRIETSQKLSAVQSELARRERLVTDENKKAEVQARRTAAGFKGYEKVVGDLAGSSLEHLKMAQEELREKLEKAKPNTNTYNEYSKALKQVNDRIREVNGALGEAGGAVQKTDNWFLKSAERFTKYAATWLNFYKILDSAKAAVRNAMKLSDSIADIQKVSKLSAGEVDELSNAILRLDSRSSTEALHQLGYQAGMLGLHSKEDIVGFVKVADQMNWALKELGDEGAKNLMKVATATGDIKAYGVEEAMTKLGSAINEITANSAASAGPIENIVSRLSAMGSTAHYSSYELVAIASTMDAIHLPAERGATAVQRMMMSISTNTSSIANHLGITSESLRELKRSADEAFNAGYSDTTGSMAVFIRVLEAIREKANGVADPIAEIKPLFKDFGKESQRLAETMLALSNNVDMLKGHVSITSSAFKEGVSMMNEFNVKNDTAAALVARFGNAISEHFVNSSLSRWLQSVLRGFVDLAEHTEKYTGVMLTLKTAMQALVTYGVIKLGQGMKQLGLQVMGYMVHLQKQRVAIIENVAAKKMMIQYQEQGVTITQAEALAEIRATAAKKYMNEQAAIGKVVTMDEAMAHVVATGATEAHASAWEMLTMAMRSNPLGFILITITTLITFVLPLVKELIDSFTGLSEEEQRVADGLAAIEDAGARAEDEVRSQQIEAKRLFDRLIELTTQIDSLENSTKSNTKTTAENTNAKKENASAADAEGASSQNLAVKKDAETSATVASTKATGKDSQSKAINKAESDKLARSEASLASKKMERHAVIMKLQQAFPQTLSDMNLENMKVADLHNAYSQLNQQLKNRIILMGQEARMNQAKDNYLKTLRDNDATMDSELSHWAESAGIDKSRQRAFVNQAKGMMRELYDAAGDYGDLLDPNSAANKRITLNARLLQLVSDYGGNAKSHSFRNFSFFGNPTGDDFSVIMKTTENLLSSADNALNTFLREQGEYERKASSLTTDYDKMTPTERKYSVANATGRDVSDVGARSAAVIPTERPETHHIDFDSDDVHMNAQWIDDLNAVANLDGPERETRFYELLGHKPSGNKEADNKEIHAAIEKLRLKNKSMGFGPSGKSIPDKKGRTKEEAKGPRMIKSKYGEASVTAIKSWYDAALAALKGYFEEKRIEAMELREQRIITGQELESLLSDLDKREGLETNQLYKRLLGESNTFKQSTYGKWFYDKNLDKTSAFLLALGNELEQAKQGKGSEQGSGGGEGSSLIDGMQKNAATSLKKAHEITINTMNELDKILLQYDYEGTVDRNFQQTLEKLDLFWGDYQNRFINGAEETSRIQFRKFKELAEQSLTMDVATLRKKMEEDPRFAEWFDGKDNTIKFHVGYDDEGNKIYRTELENDLVVLLKTLQEHRHKLIEARKKVADEGHKYALEIAKDAIQTQIHIEKTQEANEDLLKKLQSQGFVNSATVTRFELEHMDERIAYYNKLIELIQLEKGDATKEYEKLAELKEKRIEKNAEITLSVRENMNAYVDVFNEMTKALTTAGNEHASLTSLAEIAAKRRLGIAVNETKTEYMIYSRNGKAIRKMMTEEEKLTWDMQNDARNQQLDALVKWMHDWGEKMAQDFTNAVNSQMAIDQQRAYEQAMLEEADKAANGRVEIKAGESESVKMLEAQITGHLTRQVNERLAEVSREMAARYTITKEGLDKIAGLYAANNGVESVQSHAATDNPAWKKLSDAQSVPGDVVTDDWKKRIADYAENGMFADMNSSARAMLDRQAGLFATNAAIEQKRIQTEEMLKRFKAYKASDADDMEFGELANWLQWMNANGKTGSKKWTAAFGAYNKALTEDPTLNDNSTFTVEGDNALGYADVIADKVKAHKEANAEMLQNDIETHQQMVDSQNAANTQMTERHKNMIQAMISAANLYGVVYNAVMNDSLSASQRAGMATLQAFGQVAMSMLSVLMADTLASVTGKTVEGTARIWGKFATNPWVAIPMVAALTATMGGLTALATRKITKSKQEIAAVTGAASGKKVAAGMLTYAEGNYPVLGSDGEVYDAKRETNWKTKVYSSPHYGILGEKGPELIVDGVTTRKMMTLRPDLYQDILDLARGRQAVRAKAYADGNYPAMPAVNGGGGAGADTNAMLVAAISQLNAQLAKGLKVASLGEDGAVRNLNDAEDWMRKHGLI